MCRWSGRNDGHRWLPSFAVVTGLGVPPAASIFCNPVTAVAEKTITLSRFQVPPPARPAAAHSVTGCPPDTSIFLRLAAAKKATDRPSDGPHGWAGASGQ